MTQEWDRESILEVSGAFQKCRILLTAAELDLFSRLSRGPITVEELCSREGWSERGLRILMDALAGQGIVHKSLDGKYSADESVCALLGKDHDDSILPLILHKVHLWKTWSNLTEIVKTGENPDPIDKRDRPKEEWDAFIGAMHVIGRRMAGQVVDSVELGSFHRLLDVGGGSGTYVMAFLERAPHLTATVFDLPAVIEMARKRLTEAGFIGRVDLVAGDYNADELPGGHDLALLSAIIHSNSREGNQRLYARIYRRLKSGGSLIIRDHIMDETRTRPPLGAVFAVNMLVATQAGNTYTFGEIREDLELAGFREVRLMRQGQTMDQLVMATK